jgi:hypothetical protein
MYVRSVSLKRFDIFFVAMGCTLLGAKVEEHSRPLRDVCKYMPDYV